MESVLAKIDAKSGCSAFINLIKNEKDSTPLGQRPLCVLPVVYRVWASVRRRHLQDWFYSWVPSSVFSAGNGVLSGRLVLHRSGH